MQKSEQNCEHVNVCEHEDISKIIEDTVNVTVMKLKMAGLMRDDRKSAFQKTEELLRNYTAFKKVEGQSYTKKLVDKMDAALSEIKDDIYYDIIPMIYFERLTREDVAERFNTTVTTVSRNKTRLVNKLKAYLYSDEFIFELFL